MILLEIGLAYQFLFCITLDKALIPGSSAVEQATVNRLAGGSNPSRGAKFYYKINILGKNRLEVDHFTPVNNDLI